MITLALDASTYVGTVAVFDGEVLLAAGEAAMRGKDSERLMPLVIETLRRASIDVSRVGRVACGAGPGSFTSLRIAASIAKGIAAGRGVPLVPVSSLGLVVAANAPDGAHRYLAVLDALRDESYVQVLEVAGSVVRPLDEPRVAPRRSVPDLAGAQGAQLAGPGLANDWLPHARGALRLPIGAAADLAGWEPDYGRKAEAQARWEAEHGRPLTA